MQEKTGVLEAEVLREALVGKECLPVSLQNGKLNLSVHQSSRFCPIKSKP